MGLNLFLAYFVHHTLQTLFRTFHYYSVTSRGCLYLCCVLLEHRTQPRSFYIQMLTVCKFYKTFRCANSILTFSIIMLTTTSYISVHYICVYFTLLSLVFAVFSVYFDTMRGHRVYRPTSIHLKPIHHTAKRTQGMCYDIKLYFRHQCTPNFVFQQKFYHVSAPIHIARNGFLRTFSGLHLPQSYGTL